jgi:hypothetical protein
MQRYPQQGPALLAALPTAGPSMQLHKSVCHQSQLPHSQRAPGSPPIAWPHQTASFPLGNNARSAARSKAPTVQQNDRAIGCGLNILQHAGQVEAHGGGVEVAVLLPGHACAAQEERGAGRAGVGVGIGGWAAGGRAGGRVGGWVSGWVGGWPVSWGCTAAEVLVVLVGIERR